MNVIDFSSLIPQTDENEEVIAVIYRAFQDDYVRAVGIPSKSIVKFFELTYPERYRLFCRNTCLLEGKNRKFYFSLINVGRLNTEKGVEIFIKSKDPSSIRQLLNIILLPVFPLIKAVLNKVLGSKFNYRQLEMWAKILNLFKLYLSAGYDIEFDSGLLKGRKIENPYSALRKEFDDEQLKIFKAMGKVNN